MGCASPTQMKKSTKGQTVAMTSQKDKIEMNLFAGAIEKQNHKPSRSNNYQYYQSPVAPPLFKEGKPITMPNFREYDILSKPQERIYKVPKISYPRLGLNMKDLQLKKS